MIDHLLGCHAEIETTATAAHVDRVRRQRELVDHSRETALLAEGADAPEDVPGDTLGGIRRTHVGSLAAERSSHSLQRELTGDRHDCDNLGVVERHDEGLEDLERIEIELLGRLETEAAIVSFGLVLVHRERNARRFEGGDRRRHPAEYGRRSIGTAAAAVAAYSRHVRITAEPSTDPGDYEFAHRLRVRFAETDAMGIVHHSRYLPMLEEARVAYLRHIGHPYTDLRAEGVEMNVLEAWCRYRRPLEFDELVDVHVHLAGVERASFQMGYLLTVDAEVRATGVTAHGAVNADGRPVRLPAWLRAKGTDATL